MSRARPFRSLTFSRSFHTTCTSRASNSASAKLFQDALEEESQPTSSVSNRDQLRLVQGPIWTGDESAPDAVLRMLVDAHKPLRSGEGIKHNASDEKIRGWMKGLSLEPRLPSLTTTPEKEPVNPHKTTIPPHLHRPWHSTYTGENQATEEAKIRYGTFIKRQGESLDNILELKLPPNADAKTRARVRDARKAGKLVRRFENAREGALDYKLAVADGNGDTFEGNRQVKGTSVLGAQKGTASGLRAWTGVVEDRILRAKEAGFFKVNAGLGKPIPRDPEAGNPHIENGELLMNRIVKRQGALPPWIELQNNLDSSLNAFRSTVLQTYTTHLVRSVMSSTSLVPLPPQHTLPERDDAWEARERNFHEENVKQINDLVRRMNAVAPSVVRRPLITLHSELDRIRGDQLRQSVWNEIKRRSEELQYRPATVSGGEQSLFRRAAHRSLSTVAAPLRLLSSPQSAASGKKSGAGPEAKEPSGLALSVICGLGVLSYICFRKPSQNDSDYQPMPEPLPLGTLENTEGFLSTLQAWIVEPILTFFRFIHLFLLFAPVIFSAPMLLVGKPKNPRRPGKPVATEEENWGAVWWYGFLVRQMERAGPSFIKLGQWAASRADLFPTTLCDRMSKLHSNGKPHSFQHTQRVISKAFGVPFDDIFDVFDERPIGCGAIAQVYKATLRSGFSDSSNRTVAIKVLHPRARKTIRRDIAIMSVFANAINALPGMQWISLPDEVLVFGEMMNSQLDLRVEAANLDRFQENFTRRGRQVTFPRPIKLGDVYGRRRDESMEVLMEEFQDALPLKHFLRNGGGPYDEKIANIGLDAFLEMLLLDNWTHGDLHPGNIMVRFFKPETRDLIAPIFSRLFPATETAPTPSSTELVHELASLAHDPERWLSRLDELDSQGYVPQLIFIDAGLVTSLNDTNRHNFLDLFQAVAEFDGYKAGKLMVARCRTPEHVIDEETFALKLQHLVLSVKSKTFSLAKIKISDILTDVLTAVRQHHVKLEGDFVNTVISILLLEGIGRQLDPNLDLFKSALPILRQLGRQLGTREAIAAVPSGNIWAMAKLWVWVEAREVAGEASAIESWIKYDRLSPAI